ncbi:Smr/MutS family protein [Balneola sp. MJW-20]|uniref:Smr/MutS family protein n=1 Tax=Gracilimonas aurantiaca TaxID=3234185 RepID=UPI003466F27A
MTEDAEPYPIDGVLDLHLFRPSDIGDLIPEYISECINNNIYSIRIIHGKGKGVLRRTVHSLLERDERVDSYRLASDRSSWGATLAELKK